MKVFCAIALRNEARFLPGFLHHIRDHVDGIVALDDGSSDATTTILATEPKVLALLRDTDAGHAAHAHETANRYRLFLEAQRLGADWVLCADADERYETTFLRRLHREAWMGEHRQRFVRLVNIVNLWDSPLHYRLDGPSGSRWTARMFRLPRRFTARPPGMHQPWFPPELDGAPMARMHARLYHLRMIEAADRRARFAKFDTVDASASEQSIGYRHMIEESGLRLRRVSRWRAYADLPRPAPATAPPEVAAPARTAPPQLPAPGFSGFDFAAIFGEWRQRWQ